MLLEVHGLRNSGQCAVTTCSVRLPVWCWVIMHLICKGNLFKINLSHWLLPIEFQVGHHKLGTYYKFMFTEVTDNLSHNSMTSNKLRVKLFAKSMNLCRITWNLLVIHTIWIYEWKDVGDNLEITWTYDSDHQEAT